MTMTTLSPAEYNVCLISALNLSLPTNRAKLPQTRAKAAAKQQILAQLQQILAPKMSHTFGTAVDAAASYPPLGLEAPPGLCLLDGIAPAPSLVPPTALAFPDRAKVGECQKIGISGTDDHLGSDAECTSISEGSMTRSVSDGTESEAENFQIDADAPCFLPSFASTALREVPSTNKATRSILQPVWVCVRL